eukprot:TRINITY_DN2134_c0_g1_i4.p1 TRINITY_DN2134_c0_g1~~TRINITY_DN2134_c0_g1_i4.p1  ORF type:complete len:404 (-),score=65.44 TRINITY_DN2134_c0_g1_i4:1537-2748(-)
MDEFDNVNTLVINGVRTDQQPDWISEGTDWMSRGIGRRLIVVTSLQTSKGAKDHMMRLAGLQRVELVSWTWEDYMFAFQEEEFWNKVKDVIPIEEGQNKEDAIRRKFVYAGGSARWLFGRKEEDIQKLIDDRLRNVGDASILFQEQIGDTSLAAVNEKGYTLDDLYGTQTSSGNCITLYSKKNFEVEILQDKPIDPPLAKVMFGMKVVFVGEAPLIENVVKCRGQVQTCPDDTTAFAIATVKAGTTEKLARVKAQKIPIFPVAFLEALKGTVELRRFDQACAWLKEQKNLHYLKTAEASREFHFFETFSDDQGEESRPGTWLIPTKWNQACYDVAHYPEEGVLRVIQLTRARTHSLKLPYVVQLLQALRDWNWEPSDLKVFGMVRKRSLTNSTHVMRSFSTST